MLLYHGTSPIHLAKILRNGIRPRGAQFSKARKGNWSHTVDSNPSVVYLTECYAGYFAANAVKKGAQFLILEIDTDKLDANKLVPDEDFLGQVWNRVKGADLMSTTKAFRSALADYRGTDLWQRSIKGMGTCGYMGVIRAEAIVRHVIFDANASPLHNRIWWEMMDPSISVENYRFVGEKYRRLTRVLMGDMTPQEYLDSDPMRAMLEPFLEKLKKQTGG